MRIFVDNVYHFDAIGGNWEAVRLQRAKHAELNLAPIDAVDGVGIPSIEAFYSSAAVELFRGEEDDSEVLPGTDPFKRLSVMIVATVWTRKVW